MKKIILLLITVLLMTSCGRDKIYIPDDFFAGESDEIYVTFPQLSEGVCALVETSDNKAVLIGCSGAGDFSAVYEFLKSKDVTDIHSLILLSDDDDYSGGLSNLIANVSVSAVYIGEHSVNKDKFKTVCSYNSSKKCDLYLASEGTRIFDEKGLTIDVVSSAKTDGKAVLSLYISYDETAMFFEGDGTLATEVKIAENMGESIKSDIFVVPHCGEKELPHTEILDATKPELAIIPVHSGKYPSFGSIHNLQEQNIEILQTDANGTITVVMDGKAFKTYKER